MSVNIKLEPVKEENNEQIQKNEKTVFLPEKITKNESSYILEQVYNMISTYYSTSQIDEIELPKNPNWYLNEILILFVKMGIIEID